MHLLLALPVYDATENPDPAQGACETVFVNEAAFVGDLVGDDAPIPKHYRSLGRQGRTTTWVQVMSQQDVDHVHTINRFNSEGVAERYSQKKHDRGWRNRRELTLIDSAIDGLGRDAEVLDLPSGSGRLAIHPACSGYQATGADASPKMVRIASKIADEQGIETIGFLVRDVLDTKFSDEANDAGLPVKRVLWVKPWLSPQCYAVFEPIEQYLRAQ